MMADTYTIGQLAKAIDLPTSTIRYYERRGLLCPTSRSSGNYRIYKSDAVERLQFIRAAQATGFTLDDIATLLRFRDGSKTPCQAVERLIETRLLQVDEQMRELRRVNRVLKASLKLCKDNERKQACGVLEKLGRKPG